MTSSIASTVSASPLVFDYHIGLPPHCDPTTPFLRWFAATFHVCTPTTLAFLSTLFGVLSICSWLFAQLPQIYKNWKLRSTAGLSFFFLVEWLLGDLSNLIGGLFTGQATWQVVLASYYVFVDVCLCLQWIWYTGLGKGRRVRRGWFKGDKKNRPSARTSRRAERGPPAERQRWNEDPKSVVPNRVPIDRTSLCASDTGTKNITPSGEEWKRNYGTASSGTSPASKYSGSFKHPGIIASSSPEWSTRTITRDGNGVSSISSPHVALYTTIILMLVVHGSVAAYPNQASGLLASGGAGDTDESSPIRTRSVSTEIIGTIVSWMSTFLYLGSRVPQLLHNFRRRSTAGLSLTLFAAAFSGNMFYSLSMLTNPCAWWDFGAWGESVIAYPGPGSGSPSFLSLSSDGPRAPGWVGPDGSSRTDWVLRALPFFLGAAGVLVMDGAMGLQFWYYSIHRETARSGRHKGIAVPVILIPEHEAEECESDRVSLDSDADSAVRKGKGRSERNAFIEQRARERAGAVTQPVSVPRTAGSTAWLRGPSPSPGMGSAAAEPKHWRRVSGWMRGWIPTVSLSSSFNGSVAGSFGSSSRFGSPLSSSPHGSQGLLIPADDPNAPGIGARVEEWEEEQRLLLEREGEERRRLLESDGRRAVRGDDGRSSYGTVRGISPK